MCSICALLDDTWPGPKNLARAIMESNLPSEHVNVIMDKVGRDLDDSERQTLINEMTLEILRIS